MILHNKPYISKSEINVASNVLKSKNLSLNFQTTHFENELSKFLKISKDNLVVCSSGSAALFLALWAVNASNKHISYPSYVCGAVRNAVNLINAKHNVLDIFSENSPNLNHETIQKSKSKICIVPHMYGIPIASGLYVIHINAPGIGEKVIKWFGTMRPIDLNTF